MTYRTLQDWGRQADASAQPIPVGVVFFTADSLVSFVKELAARDEDDESWDLPPSVKKSVEAAYAADGAK